MPLSSTVIGSPGDCVGEWRRARSATSPQSSDEADGDQTIHGSRQPRVSRAGGHAVSASRSAPARSAGARRRRPAAPASSASGTQATSLDLDVLVGQLAAGRRRSRKWWTVLWIRRPSATNQKSMVPSLATTSAGDAGLLRDLADRGVLRRLAGLDVALRQRPEQPAAPVGAADQRARARPAPRLSSDQPAGASLLDPPHRRRRERRWHGSIVVAAVSVASRLSANAAAGRRRRRQPLCQLPRDRPGTSSAEVDGRAVRRAQLGVRTRGSRSAASVRRCRARCRCRRSARRRRRCAPRSRRRARASTPAAAPG